MKLKTLVMICLLGFGNGVLFAQEAAAVAAVATAAPAATAAATAPLDCETYTKGKKQVATDLTKSGNNEDLDGSGGSGSMKRCVEISGNNMRYLYKNQRRSIEFNWQPFIDANEDCIAISTACSPNANIAAQTTKCDNFKKEIVRCDAAAFLISQHERDWNSSDDVKTDTVKGGNPEIKCTGNGIETLDYKGCVEFVQGSDNFEAVQGVAQKGQELIYADKTMTAQAEAMKSPESATAGLKALKGGLIDQSDMMKQRAGVETVKLTYLISKYNSIPDYDSLKEECDQYKTLPNANGLTGIDPVALCQSAVAQQPGFAFIENQQAKEKMKSKLIAVGGQVAIDGIQASLLSSQADDVNKAIAKVETFKPFDPLAPVMGDLQSTYCQQNPGDPKCLTGGLERTFDASGDNVITFGDGGTGTSYVDRPQNLDASGNPLGPSAIDRKNIDSRLGVGSVISNSEQKGGLENSVAAATVTKGSAPTGGGGGGGAGGGASGGGGGGGAPGSQQAGGMASAIPGKAPSYGGGSGTLSMMGGFGINKAKSGAKDEGNPFGKLFNKEGNKSGAIDFGRAPASQKVGTKTDNLFEMISKRYTNVSGEKRLIEYELTK